MSNNAKESRPSNEPPQLTTWSSLALRQLNTGQSKHQTTAGFDPFSAVKGKGKGRARAIGNPDSGHDDVVDSSDDERYKSFRLANGIANGQKGKGKGKGKDKGKAPALTDGFVDTEDEDLYT